MQLLNPVWASDPAGPPNSFPVLLTRLSAADARTPDVSVRPIRDSGSVIAALQAARFATPWAGFAPNIDPYNPLAVLPGTNGSPQAGIYSSGGNAWACRSYPPPPLSGNAAFALAPGLLVSATPAGNNLLPSTITIRLSRGTVAYADLAAYDGTALATELFTATVPVHETEARLIVTSSQIGPIQGWTEVYAAPVTNDALVEECTMLQLEVLGLGSTYNVTFLPTTALGNSDVRGLYDLAYDAQRRASFRGLQ